MRAVLLSLPLLLAAAGAAAADAAKPPPCAAAEFHQFDFWIGDWTVTQPDGKPAGSSHIEAILGGCAIGEHWTGAKGSVGKSYNAYDPQAKQWNQYWVGNDGQPLGLSGGLQGKAMVLSGSHPPQAGVTTIERITWTPNADGSVRQLWEQSTDGGTHWTTAFDGLYRKAAK